MNKILNTYDRFFHLSHDLLCLLDLEGHFVDVNPAWYRTTGLKQETLRHQSLLEFIHPQDQAIIQTVLNRLREGASSQRVEARHRSDNQEYHWLQWEMTASPDEGLIYGIARNLTERKANEATLQQQHRELELLNRVIAALATDLEVEEMLEMVCRELALTFTVPKTVAALLNSEKTEEQIVAEYRREEQSTTIGYRVLVADSPALQYMLTYKAPLVISQAQEDRRVAHIHDLLHQQGVVSLLILPLVVREEMIGSLILEATTPRTFSAEEVSLAWNVADQVAVALTQSRMAQTQRHLLTAMAQTTNIILVTDADDLITYVNPAFERTTGYSQAEALGRTPSDFLSSERPGESDYKTIWETIRRGKVWQGRLTSRRKDGQDLIEEVTITPVRNEQRQPVSYVTVKRDVTHELQLAEQLRQSQKLEAVGQLAGGIAHDFNNLLMVIAGHTELLLNRTTEPLASFQAELLEIKKAADRAANLTRQLLAFSRKQLLQPAILDLNRIIIDLQRMVQPLLNEQITLALDLTELPCYIKADPGQIEQVILNLVINARDAMPLGGQLIFRTDMLELKQAQSRSLNLKAGAYVRLTVRDTGVGMDRDTQARIFEPFFTTKGVGKGTGLGLATSYGIIQQSQGHIGVDSTPSQGTTFEIYLPRVKK